MKKLELNFTGTARAAVPETLFGCNIEHTRSCLFGGLSAQMLRNRKFTGIPSANCGCAEGWYPIGKRALFRFADSYTRHDASYRKPRQDQERNAQCVVNVTGEESGIGQHGLYLKKGAVYELAVVVKANDGITLRTLLTDRYGKKRYAESTAAAMPGDWQRVELRLTSSEDDPDADLRIFFSERGSVTFGAVSLMREGHFRGMRRDVIDCFREMGVRVLRWPGGNFAGDYNWMDGLLPRDMRAPLLSSHKKTNAHTMGYDDNDIATDDFIALCCEVGAEPFITINPTWDTPAESGAWVEYCNGDGSTPFGHIRAEHGHEEPYNVRLWSLGNEFGHGHMEGANTPESYARLAAEHGKRMIAASPDLPLELCSSGPYPNEQWVERSARPLASVARTVSQHFYGYAPQYTGAGSDREEYLHSLSSVEKVRRLIRELHRQLATVKEDVLVDQDLLVFVDLAEGLSHRQTMSADTPLSISFDEWNVWNAWYRPSSISDGIYTALFLHMLMEESGPCSVSIACHFQAVNEGLISVTPEEGAKLAAQGQIFRAMSNHAGGKLLSISPNAAVTEGKDGTVTATVVNDSWDEELTVVLPGSCDCSEGKLYPGESVLPPSRFEESDIREEARSGKIVLPPHSVLLLRTKHGSSV